MLLLKNDTLKKIVNLKIKFTYFSLQWCLPISIVLSEMVSFRDEKCLPSFEYNWD